MVWVRVSSSFIFISSFFFAFLQFSGWLDSFCYLSNVHEAYNLTIVSSFSCFYAFFLGFF